MQGNILTGQSDVPSDPSKNWDVDLRRRLLGSASEVLLGPEARAQRISKLSAAERPFAVGQEAKGWLDGASLPTEGSGASSSSLYGLPEGYSPAQMGMTGDSNFDPAAEQQTKQYLASLSDAPEKPFAASKAVKGWLEEVSAPIADSSSLTTSSLSEVPEGYSPSQEGITGDSSFDAAAEEQTRQYLAGLDAATSSTVIESTARQTIGFTRKST